MDESTQLGLVDEVAVGMGVDVDGGVDPLPDAIDMASCQLDTPNHARMVITDVATPSHRTSALCSLNGLG